MNVGLEDTLRNFLKGVLIDVFSELRLLQAESKVIEPTNQTLLRLLRPREAAQALGISSRHLFELTRRKAIPCVRLGRLTRYDEYALVDWLSSLRSSEREPLVPPPDEAVPRGRRRNPATIAAGKQKKRSGQPQSKKRFADEPKAKHGRQPADIRKVIAERMGIERDSLPGLTHGDAQRITGLDIVTWSNYVYRGGQIPESAISELQRYYANLPEVQDAIANSQGARR